MSKIDRIEIHEFTYQVDNLGTDHAANWVYTPGARATIKTFIVMIEADNGARGEYCPSHSGKQPAMLGHVLALAPLLIGRDPHRREAIFGDFKRLQRHFTGVGLSAVDICLWDLAGKELGAPVSKLLGGFRERLPAYASTLHGDRNGGLSGKEAFADFAEQCLELGFRGFKIHGWSEADPEEEAENVRHIGRRLGGRMKLMIDPASELRTFADALHVGRACDEMEFFWYEDPFRDTGVAPLAHRRLREMIRTPLLLTEHVRGLEAKACWVVEGGTDFLRADPEYDMGITGTIKTAHLAEAFGLDIELHACGPAQRHCIAAIRNTNFYELSLVAPGVRNPIPPIYACDYSDDLEAVGRDGCYPVPTGPGLGVTYDWGYIARNRVSVHRFEQKVQ